MGAGTPQRAAPVRSGMRARCSSHTGPAPTLQEPVEVGRHVHRGGLKRRYAIALEGAAGAEMGRAGWSGGSGGGGGGGGGGVTF